MFLTRRCELLIRICEFLTRICELLTRRCECLTRKCEFLIRRCEYLVVFSLPLSPQFPGPAECAERLNEITILSDDGDCVDKLN